MRSSALIIGDGYMSLRALAPLQALEDVLSLRWKSVDPNSRPPLPGLREYQGNPAVMDSWLTDEKILIVHAAPVTRDLLAAHPHIELVACLRGGPVNIDLEAARDLGVTVTNTPGKNAASVADLTMLYIYALLRRVLEASSWITSRAQEGQRVLDSAFIGGDWMGREPSRLTLGLIGYGAIGRLVAARAQDAGMRVIVYDPYVTDHIAHGPTVSLDQIARESDIVSLHAKSTEETRHIVDASFLDAMRPGSFVVNTARESLVDESALLHGLESGRLAGIALDVCESRGLWPQLSQHANAIITPHLGGATEQTQERGIAMAMASIRAFLAGSSPMHRVT